VEWIHLAEEREKWRAFVKTVTNLRVAYRKRLVLAEKEKL